MILLEAVYHCDIAKRLIVMTIDLCNVVTG